MKQAYVCPWCGNWDVLVTVYPNCVEDTKISEICEKGAWYCNSCNESFAHAEFEDLTSKSLRIKTSNQGLIQTILTDHLCVDLAEIELEMEGLSWVNVFWKNMPDITDRLVEELKKQEKNSKFYWKIVENKEMV